MRVRRRRAALASIAAASLVASLGALAPAGAAPRTTEAAAVTTQRNPGWGLDRLDERLRPLDARYRARSSGAGVTAYVIDCGMETGNAQFGGRAVKGKNVVGGSWTECTDEMAVGHATFVAGIIGGATTGVAKKVGIVAVRAIAGGEGQPTPPEATGRRDVVRAVDWVIADHAKRKTPAVVNMSLGFDAPFPALAAAMARLEKARITAVVAAGNESGSACQHSPANVRSALTVAASTSTDRRWSGSNYGACVDLFAPGLSVRSVAAGGGVFRYDGSGATSWATPYVTGAAALYLSAHPKASPASVRSWILSNSTKGQLRGLASNTANRLLYSFGPL